MSLFHRRSNNPPPKTPLATGYVTSSSRSSSSRSVSRIPTSGARSSYSVSRIPSSVARGFKDNRPISDKNYQHQMMVELQQNLASFGMDVEMRQLKNPTKSDFVRYFEKLFEQLNDGYKLGQKIEEEVPRIFRLLGYPVTVKTSTMQTISAGHSWPHAMAALLWMCSIVTFALSVVPEDFFFGTDDDEEESKEKKRKKASFRYVVLSCEAEMQGNEDVSMLDEEWKETLLEGDEINDEEFLEKELGRLQAEYTELSNEPKEEVALAERLEAFQLDNEKLNTFIGDLMEFRNNAAKTMEADKKERIAIEKESEKVKADASVKMDQISSQKISRAEVLDLIVAKDQAEQRISDLRKELQNQQEIVIQAQTGVTKMRFTLESKYGTFAKSARALIKKIQPEDQNWEAEFPWDKSPMDPKFTSVCQKTLKPGMNMLVTKCIEARNKAEKNVLEMEPVLERLRDEITTLRDDAVKKKAALEKKIKESEESKERRKMENNMMNEEVERLNTVMENFTKMKAMSCEEKEKRLRHLTTERDELKRTNDAKLQEKEKDVSIALELVSGFSETLEVKKARTLALLKKVARKKGST